MAWPHGRSRDGGVDEIPLPASGGRLYLCGKHAVAPDPDALLARVEATTVVCLNERHELADRYPGYLGWLAANAPGRALHHPIPDLYAPTLAELAELVTALHERLAAGERLVLHCGAGIGRAGTVAVALLVHAGSPLEEALATVRAHRPMAGPEVGAQSEVLAAFAGARLQRRDQQQEAT